MKPYIILFCLLSSVIFFSCDSSKKKSEDESAITNTDSVENSKSSEIKITPLTGSPDFPDAIIEMNTPGQFAELDPGKVEFAFEIKNFMPGQPTKAAIATEVKKFNDGQHIKVILNNEIVAEQPSPQFYLDLQPGYYVSLAFLARSYHESVKTYGASVARQFNVGGTGSKEIDLTTPMLFYNQPTGEYNGTETKKILLDFYLLNTELSANGNKVRVTINDSEFIIDQWVAYIIEGLPIGENTIRLELIDKNGKAVPGPYNSVERKIELNNPQL